MMNTMCIFFGIAYGTGVLLFFFLLYLRQRKKMGKLRKESEKSEYLASNLAHEIKTQMTTIMGYSQLLYSYPLSDPERKEAAGTIYQEAKRLEEFSLQLLELYVCQNDRISLEPVSLASIGERLKKNLKYLSEKYQVFVHVDFKAESVTANPVLLLSLLYNLADNALKASAPRAVVRIYSETISPAPRQTDPSNVIRIVIADKGCGIAKEKIKPENAGLGLTLCSRIAAVHGTELNIESEKGSGTTVSFLLKKTS